jgi:uncharacterized protein (TIGR01777 family)
LRIVISGANGQVGTVLARHFHEQAHDVIALCRSPKQTRWRSIEWDGAHDGPWQQSVDGADVVIQLAGRSVNCRYTAQNRREILDSRIRTTRLMGETIASAAHPPRVWLNASTATIYRHALDRPMDEESGELGGSELGVPETWRFSIQVAREWEAALNAVDTPRTRKVAMRSAMTMSPDAGGVFDAFLGLVRKGLGGASGSGRQYVSWIHDVDFIRAVEFLIEHEELSGPVNLSSPNPLPNAEFMRVLRDAWGIPVGLPATEWMLEIGAVFLKTETELILKSRQVVPVRLLKAGFAFEFPLWPGAASDLVRRWREAHQASGTI